ncbi:MAG: DUF3313 domain-containing protein [Planctomycetota bacterium]|nr:DUF3313 domain-containing protein [Planctomycetota bacterium]
MFKSALLLALTASCANLEVPRTNFLADRDALTPSEAHDVTFIPDAVELQVTPGATATRWERVIVDPVVWTTVPDSHPDLDGDDRAELIADFERYLREDFGDRYELVDLAGPATLRVRASLSDANPQWPLSNVLGLLLLVPWDMGGIAGEVELVDASSGERLVAFAAHRDGTPFLIFEAFTRFGQARHGMQKWTSLLLELVEADA